ncbi:MAG: hypothetical protein PHG64_14675 [Paludibacter sp.]|nr:hypothetical protein [Paludibacter sp.]
MIEYRKLDVEYDQIVILDLLSDAERTKWKITEELNSVLTTEGFSTRILNLSTKQELLDAISQLTIESQAGKRFMLHFVGHGDDECICYNYSGEDIFWSDLEEPLRTLNTAANESLLLNMTTCEGLNAIKAVDHLKGELPFFGIIGYSDVLYSDDAIVGNRIFYLSMANGMQIQEAIEKVKKDTGDDKFHCITAQGYAAIKNKIEQQK